ncbi:MAG: holliday junction helicase RuvA [Patescibacteria group bacterium]|nr:holliday junction helicase RuvA [Patescibacteria group bacterium]
MIGKLTGVLDSLGAGQALIDVSGVGYVVRVPAGLEGLLPPSSVVTLFIYTAVREDAIDLYGFATNEELGFFKLLMGVSGVGPKTALGIMSVADVLSLKRAIAKGDAAALTSTFGIGKKSAERLVVELRDKIKLLPADTTPDTPSDADVIEALQGLGYSALESRKALRDISPTLVGTRERLAAALRNLGTNTA